MPRTKPLYIHPSSEAYDNLLDELVDIHKKIQTGDMSGIRDQISDIVKEVEDLRQSTSLTDQEINKELSSAKGVYPSINDRFLSLDHYDILKNILNINTTRNYEYSQKGQIIKEIVRGDLNYDTTFVYDSYDNIINETKTDLSGNVISERNYTYTPDGNVSSVRGVNTDEIMLLSNALVDSEQDKRLEAIEAIDFVELGKTLDGWDLIGVAQTVQELVTQVQHLMLNLPENIGYLIDTSELYRRLDTIEQRLDANEIYYAFDVQTNVQKYNIPEHIIGKRFAVFMEGLLLERDVDYEINDNTIVFTIPLIDGFTVTFKD